MGRLHCTQDPVPEAVGGDMQQLNQLGAQVGPGGRGGAGPEVAGWGWGRGRVGGVRRLREFGGSRPRAIGVRLGVEGGLGRGRGE
jgi:hypothetical protein